MADSRSAQPVRSVDNEVRNPSTTLELIIAWLWVGIPLVWGVWHVILTSLKLFQ